MPLLPDGFRQHKAVQMPSETGWAALLSVLNQKHRATRATSAVIQELHAFNHFLTSLLFCSAVHGVEAHRETHLSSCEKHIPSADLCISPSAPKVRGHIF